jgi:hypothetical protein
MAAVLPHIVRLYTTCGPTRVFPVPLLTALYPSCSRFQSKTDIAEHDAPEKWPFSFLD